MIQNPPRGSTLIRGGTPGGDVDDDDTSTGDSTSAPKDSGTTPSPVEDAGSTPVDAAPAKSAMTFFATSTGTGANGGNLGGLAGADTKCQTLATAAGGGDHKWAAYLSTNTNNGGAKVDAKSRIGAGPWKNQKGVEIAASVAALHTAGFNLKTADVLDEKGAQVPVAGPNRHDIFTGSNADGTASMKNCRNWTSNAAAAESVMGHSDSQTTGNGADRWNNAHDGNCEQGEIAGQGGEGRFYCFATD